MSDALINEIRQLNHRIELLETDEALPICAKYTTASDSIGSGGTVTLDFNTKVYDTWNAVTTGANWVFTVPIGGYYIVRPHVLFDATNAWALGELASLMVRKNAATIAYLDYQNHMSGTGIYARLAGSIVVETNKDDTLDIRIYQASGSTLTLRSAGTFNYVCIARLG